MTKQEIIDAISGAVRGDENSSFADRQKVANGVLAAAIEKVGKMPTLDFNKRRVEFSLSAGQAEYTIGVDILSGTYDILGMTDLRYTDTHTSPCTMTDNTRFEDIAVGSTMTGRPTKCTLMRVNDKLTLLVWPTPYQAYTVKTKTSNRIASFDKIPAEYHPMVLGECFRIQAAQRTIQGSVLYAQEERRDAEDTGDVVWRGNSIPLGRHLASRGGNGRVDTNNLRGD